MKTLPELQRDFLVRELVVESGARATYADIFARWSLRRRQRATGENLNEAIDGLLAEDAMVRLNVFRVGRIVIGARLRRRSEKRARSIGARLSEAVDSGNTSVS